MYLGIHISETYISAATVNQDQDVIMINDEDNAKEQQYLTPLNIYIEERYAYLGKPVDFLMANDHKLNYCSLPIKELSNEENIVYTDDMGGQWNALTLLSVFLKKLKSNVELLYDEPVSCAVVSISTPVTASLITALQKAFRIVDMPLCGVIDIGKAALKGYNLRCEKGQTKNVLLFDLDPKSISISIERMTEGDYCTTIISKSNKELGVDTLRQYLLIFLVKRYLEITKTEIKKCKKNEIILKELVNELLQNYSSKTDNCFKTTFAFQTPAIDMMIIRPQIQMVLSKYLEQTINFVNECLEEVQMTIGEIDEILITGNVVIEEEIQKTLKTFFQNEAIKIHNNLPEQVLTSGVTRYANTTAEREISASLLSSTELKPKKEDIEEKGNDSNFNQLSTLVQSLHINLGCEIQF